VFIFEACKESFFVVMASLKEMLFGFGSLDFEERDERYILSHRACPNL